MATRGDTKPAPPSYTFHAHGPSGERLSHLAMISRNCDFWPFPSATWPTFGTAHNRPSLQRRQNPTSIRPLHTDSCERLCFLFFINLSGAIDN